jgi:predicted enzyme related to lactoylglutathione lyase
MPEPSVFRPNGISYLRLPAPDPERSAAFYAEVFGWEIRYHGSEPAFTDGSGHMIGHFKADLPVAGSAGTRPYIYVESVDATLERIAAAGGETAAVPYAEGDLWVATFCDPAGNEVGVWQTGPREHSGGR